ncbi:MAG: hypothetical protein Q7W30_00355, partial [Coriobacteriia bacterium]|nr:hypothetical protein [Coriobacteriia bacterium]
LMHDGGGDRSRTAAALPAIVDQLQRRGFRLVTLSEIMGPLPEVARGETQRVPVPARPPAWNVPMHP